MTQSADHHQLKIRHAVILCHPSPHSFCRSIATAYCDEVDRNGQQWVLRDLYALDFDPVLRDDERPAVGADPKHDVARELTELSGCDVFTLIYPIWFGSAPAMLKGYIDRVFGSGVTPQNVLLQNRIGFLTGRWLFSISTSATKDIWLDEQGQLGSMRQGFDHYIAHAFGMHLEKHMHFGHILPGAKTRWIDQYLYEVREQTKRVCAMVLAQARHAQAAAIEPVA